MKKVILLILITNTCFAKFHVIGAQQDKYDIAHQGKGAVTYLLMRGIGFNEKGALVGALVGALFYEVYFDGFNNNFIIRHDTGFSYTDIIHDMKGAAIACGIDLLLQWECRTYMIYNKKQKKIGVMIPL